MEIKDGCRMPSKYRIKSDLMLEMEKIEPQIFHVKSTANEDDDDEYEQPKATREEMIQRSRELRQLRIKESQKSAKAHHQNKIKSKKYHRILKKEKLKQQINEYELLQKTDPAAALRKIEQLDRSRIEERATLRHRNTGTWAKNLQVRAKYDKDARKDLTEQIAISRELTTKKQIDESDEDDVNNDNDDLENNISYDPFNPWLNKSTSNGNEKTNDENDAVLSSYKKYWQERNQNEKQLKSYQKDVATSNEVSKEKSNQSKEESSSKPIRKSTSALKNGWIEEDISSSENVKNKKGKKNSKKRKTKISDNMDDLFDSAEEKIREKFEIKYKEIKSNLASSNHSNKNNTEKISEDDIEAEVTNMDLLRIKKQKQRPEVDEELNSHRNGNENNLLLTRIGKTLENIKSQNSIPNKSNNDTEYINPDDIAKIKPHYLQTRLPDTVYSVDTDDFVDYNDIEFDEEKKSAIAEAFEDDDIVAEFKQEKDNEEKKNDTQEIDLSLPGWGKWSGAGIDPTKQKTKRKLILKFPAPEKRRADNKGDVVIIEQSDEKLKKHLVTDIPFPFTSVDDYEQSIRAPIGKDFVPATAHRLLIKPSITTKSGTIIEPMNENMLKKTTKLARTKTERRIAKTIEEDD